MRIYKGYEKYSEAYALPHIKENHIKCHHYGWIGMCGDYDLVKIDGRIRRFMVKDHRELEAI